VLGYIFGEFFSSSSGHPGSSLDISRRIRFFLHFSRLQKFSAKNLPRSVGEGKKTQKLDAMKNLAFLRS
jgi:hypothetical protein